MGKGAERTLCVETPVERRLEEIGVQRRDAAHVHIRVGVQAGGG